MKIIKDGNEYYLIGKSHRAWNCWIYTASGRIMEVPIVKDTDQHILAATVMLRNLPLLDIACELDPTKMEWDVIESISVTEFTHPEEYEDIGWGDGQDKIRVITVKIVI